MKKILLLMLFASNMVFAAPSNFSGVIGSALLCRDQVSAEYFNDYMKIHFGKPAFTTGGANWWEVNEILFSAEVQYIFVGSNEDFIGATFKGNPEQLIAKIKSYIGIDYKQRNARKWVASTAGVIIKNNDRTTASKMYCIGAPHTPN